MPLTQFYQPFAYQTCSQTPSQHSRFKRNKPLLVVWPYCIYERKRTNTSTRKVTRRKDQAGGFELPQLGDDYLGRVRNVRFCLPQNRHPYFDHPQIVACQLCVTWHCLTAFRLALHLLHILSSRELWNRTTLHCGFTDSSYGEAII